jgi:hypothetical protein
MKKISLLLGLCFLIAVFYFLTRPPADKKVEDQSSHPTIAQPTQNENSRLGKPSVRSFSSHTSEKSLESDLAWMRTALANANHDGVEALVLKWSVELKEHPEKLAEVLASLKSESDPKVLTCLAQIIEGGEALGNKLLADTALALAQSDSLAARRHTALSLLGKLPQVSPELSQSVARLSQEGSDNEIRNSAIATMANWISTHPDLSPGLNQELLQTINSSDNVEVRGTALQTLAIHLGELPENFTTAITGYLTSDPSPLNRAMVARALGEANEQMKDFVLPQLEKAYQTETDLETKRAILNALVRVGRVESAQILQRLPTTPQLTRDIHDYLTLFENGVTDRNELLRQKALLDEKANPPPIEKEIH